LLKAFTDVYNGHALKSDPFDIPPLRKCVSWARIAFMRRIVVLCVALLGCLLSLASNGCGYSSSLPGTGASTVPPQGSIEHIVVIFQENVSFDHYFGTYPNALNLAGETRFTPLPGTPAVDGLSPTLLLHNPNATNPLNGAGAANPFRLSPNNAATADQDHGYNAEQWAFHAGAMDLFPLSVGAADSPNLGSGIAATTGLTMGYYDGNTVTAIWNYAQHYAMSDRFFGTTFGPSVLGAINLISGQTNGVVDDGNATGFVVPDGGGGYTLVNNPEPVTEICGTSSSPLVHMTGKNVGDLLNQAGITWGFFAEGFDMTATNSNGTTGCQRSNYSDITGQTRYDYTPFLDPFQFYPSTVNPNHARPTSLQMIGHALDGSTNHQYDIHDFFDAVNAGNFPAVSFLKSAAYRDGHAGYSDPLDEQAFLVHAINTIEQTPQWSKTVIILTYDDSDGWYDHASNVINGSTSMYDSYSGQQGKCGDGSTALPGVNPSTLHAQGRCGYGPRLPLLIISPWAKTNYVSHTVTDQSSVLRFIEDTFLHQERIGQGSFDAIAGSLTDMLNFSDPPQSAAVLVLDTATGQVKKP
jgi:phospholipase C